MKKPTLSKVKKKLWVVFSEFVRKRDGLETTGSIEWGMCITCGKRYHYKMLQAGHFIAGRHNAGLFSEKGTHAQCYNCNINLKGNTLVYRRALIVKYGEGIDEQLEKEAQEIKQFTIPELEEMILSYKQKNKELDELNKPSSKS
jgi:hypothetical protein